MLVYVVSLVCVVCVCVCVGGGGGGGAKQNREKVGRGVRGEVIE